MKCPNCGNSSDLKFFMRHQDREDDTDDNNANTITILCTECGHNESYFLIDCLDEIFPAWSDRPQQTPDIEAFKAFGSMFGGENEFENSESGIEVKGEEEEFNGLPNFEQLQELLETQFKDPKLKYALIKDEFDKFTDQIKEDNFNEE